MFKKIILLVIFLSLSQLSVVCAGGLETMSFVTHAKTSDWKITVRGNFSKPGLVSANETIFSVTGESSKFSHYYEFSYRLTGRTGEKTFEMQYRFESNAIKSIKQDDKINMYLDENLYHLSFNPFSLPLYTNCTEKDRVFLKMIKLQGNTLECQITLPDCLRSGK